MATNPNTLLPAPPPEDLALAGRIRAALASKNTSTKDIENIIAATGREVTDEMRNVIAANVDFVRQGGDIDLVTFNFLPLVQPEPTPTSLSTFFPDGAEAPRYTDTIASRDPTFQERAYRFVLEQAAPFFGADPKQSREAAELLVGRREAPRAALMDITPLAALTSLPEGASTFSTGVRFGQPGTAALGALETAGGVAEALPLVGPLFRGSRRFAREFTRTSPAAGGAVSREAVEAFSPSQVPPTVPAPPAPLTPIERIAQAPTLPPALVTPIQRIAQAPELSPVRPSAQPSGSLFRGQPEQFTNLQTVGDTDAIDNILIGRGIFTTSDRDLAATYGPNVFEFERPNPAKVFDLSNPSEKDLRKLLPEEGFEDTAGLIRLVADQGDLRASEDILFEALAAKHLPEDVNWQEVKNGFTIERGIFPDEIRDLVSKDIQDAGFDFVKHQGGIRAGSGEKLHDVFIALRDGALVPKTKPTTSGSAAPLTPIERIAQAPTLPPALVTPIRRAEQVPEPAIVPTPGRVAAAERAAETMDEVPEVPVEFAGNINLSKLDTKEDVSQLLNAVAQSNDEFLTARRGVLPISEIEDLADRVSLETILGRKVGQSFSAEQIVAARRAVAATSDDAIRKAREWKANPGDENLKNAALEALMRQAAFQEQLSGGTAEIGRALRAMREVQAGDRSNALRAIVGDVTKIKDSGDINDILNLVSTLDDPNAAAKFIGDISKPTTKEKILEGWINALLAGPHTHAVNIASNALFALSKLPEEIIASGIGRIARSQDRITAREVGARSVGMVQGVRDGLRAGAKVVRGEKLPDDTSKTELTRKNAISGVKGQVVRLPSKALEIEDEFFKAVNRRSELAAEAYRVAAKEAKGDKAKFEELYRGYLDNPTDKMRKQADEFARYMTFQNQLIGWPKDVQAFANKYPSFRFLVPFIRTPVNILKAARDRSLLAPLTRQFWADVRAGGRTRDRALAKVSLGTGITGTIGYLYGQGLVTGGGPTDPGERSALLATGWQPYSFKVGDTYYSYARLEPISTVIGVSADFFTLQDQLNKDEAKNVPVLLTMSLAKNILDKTFLQGISNFFEAIMDPDRNAEKYLEGVAASFMPNVLPQIARGVDPTLRETETFPEVLQSRIPFASEALPARLDAWGDESVRVGYTKPEDSALWGTLAAVENILNPIRISQVDASSPVKTEVARLGMKVSLPQKTITYAKNDIELTREEYETYTEVSGSVAKAILDREVQTSRYKNLSEEAKKEFILEKLSDARRETREALLPLVISRVLTER